MFRCRGFCWTVFSFARDPSRRILPIKSCTFRATIHLVPRHRPAQRDRCLLERDTLPVKRDPVVIINKKNTIIPWNYNFQQLGVGEFTVSLFQRRRLHRLNWRKKSVPTAVRCCARQTELTWKWKLLTRQQRSPSMFISRKWWNSMSAATFSRPAWQPWLKIQVI